MFRDVWGNGRLTRCPGSPLNRVGFLRGDNVFLSRALKHPTASFLLCKDLQPLIQDSNKTKLAFVKYDDVKPVIGEDPYTQAEDDLIATYNSSKHVPQMIFLGIDEKVKDGLKYDSKKNTYTGAPYFAVDVTPRESVADACNSLISSIGSKGYSFAQGRVMDIDAPDGQ